MVNTFSSRLLRSFKPAFFQYCRTSGIGGGSTSRYATKTHRKLYFEYKLTFACKAKKSVKRRGNAFKGTSASQGTELGDGGQGRGAAVLLSKRKEHNMEQRFCWNLSIKLPYMAR